MKRTASSAFPDKSSYDIIVKQKIGDLPLLHHYILLRRTDDALRLIRNAEEEGIDINQAFDFKQYTEVVSSPPIRDQIYLKKTDLMYSPLYLSALYKNDSVFCALLEAGADVKSLGNNFSAVSLMMLSADFGFTESLNFLINNARSKKDFDALMYLGSGRLQEIAFENNNVNTLKFLLDKIGGHHLFVSQPTFQDYKYKALFKGHYDLFKLIMKSYSKDIFGKNGLESHLNVLLMLAFKSYLFSLKSTRILLEMGANPNAIYPLGGNDSYACTFIIDDPEKIRLLKEFGADYTKPHIYHMSYHVVPIRKFLQNGWLMSDLDFNDISKYMMANAIFYPIEFPTSNNFNTSYLLKISSVLTIYKGFFEFIWDRDFTGKKLDIVNSIHAQAHQNRQFFREKVAPILSDNDIPRFEYKATTLDFFVSSLQNFISYPNNVGNPWVYCGINTKVAEGVLSKVISYRNREVFATAAIFKNRSNDPQSITGISANSLELIGSYLHPDNSASQILKNEKIQAAKNRSI